MCIFSLNILEENPIFSAVSNLSPVNIQTLIPAFVKSSITSGTSSYSLSSTAVAPSKKRLLSISSYKISIMVILWIWSGLSSSCMWPYIRISNLANSYFFYHSRKYSLSKTLIAKQRVLYPFVENLIRSSFVASRKYYSMLFESFSKIAKSAPLQMRKIVWVLSSSTTTLIFFLSLVNSILSSNL